VEINERIQEVRKELKMNQKEFGDRLNLKSNTISVLENGIRNVTDRVIADICTEFNVREDWLRTGQGEMFLDQDLDNFFVVLGSKVGTLDDMDKKLIVEFLKLNKEEREAVKKFIRNSAK